MNAGGTTEPVLAIEDDTSDPLGLGDEIVPPVPSTREDAAHLKAQETYWTAQNFAVFIESGSLVCWRVLFQSLLERTS